MSLEERDPEILGNVYRLLGDMAFEAKDYAAAIRHCCRASYYAYVFQGVPHPPDKYTASFYQEITERIGARMEALINTDLGLGYDMLALLKTYWQPYWDQHDKNAAAGSGKTLPRTAAEIIAYLFPIAPTDDEVKSSNPAYQAQVKDMITRLDF
jgi:hypothetical protein